MNSRARLTADVVLAPAVNDHYRGRMRPRINLAVVMTMAVLVAAAAGSRASQVASREDRIPAGKTPLYSREAGRGQPIIVLHGGPDFDTRYLLPDMDRLADRFRLIYYDQRGRGQSADGVRPEDVTLASDLDDLPAPVSVGDLSLFRKVYAQQLGADLDRQREIAAGAAYQRGDPEAVTARYRLHFKHALERPADYEKLMTAMHAGFLAQGSEGIVKARAVHRALDEFFRRP